MKDASWGWAMAALWVPLMLGLWSRLGRFSFHVPVGVGCALVLAWWIVLGVLVARACRASRPRENAVV